MEIFTTLKWGLFYSFWPFDSEKPIVLLYYTTWPLKYIQKQMVLLGQSSAEYVWPFLGKSTLTRHVLNPEIVIYIILLSLSGHAPHSKSEGVWWPRMQWLVPEDFWLPVGGCDLLHRYWSTPTFQIRSTALIWCTAQLTRLHVIFIWWLCTCTNLQTLHNLYLRCSQTPILQLRKDRTLSPQNQTGHATARANQLHHRI